MSAEATHDLRRRVLRGGRAEAEVRFPGDGEALHLAVLDSSGRPVAVATALSLDCPRRPGRPAWKVRGMAVEPDCRCQGLGTWLLDAIVQRAAAAAVDVLWADARNGAVGFYEHQGWSVEGAGYVTPDTGLAHHTVILDLAPPGSG